MFKTFRFSGRFALLFHFLGWFFLTSFLVRVSLLCWQAQDLSPRVIDLIKTLLTGAFFDLGTGVYVCLPAVLYYSLFPNRWIGSRLDRILVWFFTALTVFVLVFAFFAEFTFWEEFRSRFNFIAVDYLIYTHEVVANIQESYPLPLLIAGVTLLTVLILYLFFKRGAFSSTFSFKSSFLQRTVVAAGFVAIACLYTALVRNSDAEWSNNRYNSEISKAGVYSFFAAFRNNQMKYEEFYTSIGNEKAFSIVRSKLSAPNSRFTKGGFSVHRKVADTAHSEMKKNVVFILVESLSGSFLKELGNEKNLTPFLDSLAQKSVFFENLYATGTRTVRGMEAVTLCIPPTPGQSIVKRPDNANLYTVSNVFQSKGYDNNFFYGGDGYFDNMNAYFGGNGFSIYDRGRGSVLSDAIKTTRHNIPDSDVTFENAWGICDEDIYNKMLEVADGQFAKHQPFFNFVMTTSNHRPYTYPSGKVDIPPGTNREGAVKYTDFALRELFAKAKTKPWYANTVFVIIADHCASSAGKDEIDIKNYHIPALIVNLPEHLYQKINAQCSQIDLFPTLFSLMNWSYDSDFFGKNVLQPDFEPRALLGTYRKLALLKKDKVVILSDQKKQSHYRYTTANDRLTPLPMDRSLLEETISWYQTADYLFSNKLLK